MDKLDFYKCNVCGNIVQVIVNGGGELVCCGEPMNKLEPKTNEENLTEKHVPVFVKRENDGVEVIVGETIHPMLQEHYIVFIQTVSEDKNRIQMQYLNPGEDPKMIINEIEGKMTARELCSIHGLWEGESD